MNREVPEGLNWGKPSVIVSGFSSLGPSSSSLGLRGCAPQGLGWWLLPEFNGVPTTAWTAWSSSLLVLELEVQGVGEEVSPGSSLLGS